MSPDSTRADVPPAQLAAWRELWRRLLAPLPDEEGVAVVKTATPDELPHRKAEDVRAQHTADAA